MGEPDEVYDRPANPFVFSFMGKSSQLPVEIETGEVWVDGRAIGLKAERAPQGAGQLFFRPHDVDLVEEGAALAGVVVTSRRVGGTRRVELEIGGSAQRVEMDLPFDHPAGEKTKIAFGRGAGSCPPRQRDGSARAASGLRRRRRGRVLRET